MTDTYTFPHVVFDVRNMTPGSDGSTTVSNLHNVCGFIRATKGRPMEPYYGAGSDMVREYGQDTFDTTKKYFNHQTLFLSAALGYHANTAVRICTSDAKRSGGILYATLTPTMITQYAKDALGNRQVDENGNYIPKTEANSTTPLQEQGYTITWEWVAGAPAGAGYADQEIGGATVQTVGSNTLGNIIRYPVLELLSWYPTTANMGFRLYTTTAISSADVGYTGAMLYRFEPVSLGSSINASVTAYTDVYSSNYNDIALATHAINTNTTQDVGIQSLVANNYYAKDSDGVVNPSLDYDVKVYDDSITAILNAIVATSTELTGTKYATTPALINLMSATDIEGVPFDHFVVDAASAQVVNENIVNYLGGGTEGALDDASYNAAIIDFITSGNNPEFLDVYRFDFTHVYDSGFPLAVKYALINIMGLRDCTNTTLATQDVSVAPYKAAEEQSVGQAIATRARTYPESTAYGTAAMRADIYLQCGDLTGANYSFKVPLTYWRMISRCQVFGTDVVVDTVKGRPRNEVSMFRNLTNLSMLDDARQAAWDEALNQARYCDRNTIYVPDIRSVYPNDAELPSDAEIVDYTVFVKKIIRKFSTRYEGVRKSIAGFQDTLAKDIDAEIARVWRGTLPSKTVISQSAVEKKAGYRFTVQTSLEGDMPMRIADVIIDIYRSDSAPASLFPTTTSS